MDSAPSTWATSPSLIAGARLNDGDAWRRICSLYSPLVCHWARQAGMQPDDAGDVVQQVFLLVSSRFEQFRVDRPQDTFRGWLLAITRNEIRGWYRKRSKRPAKEEGGTTALGRLKKVPDEGSGTESLEEQALSQIDQPADDSSEHGFVRRAAEIIRQEFAPQTWQAFWRCVVDERPATEVAQELSMTGNAVRQAKFRVLARMRKLFDGMSPG